MPTLVSHAVLACQFIGISIMLWAAVAYRYRLIYRQTFSRGVLWSFAFVYGSALMAIVRAIAMFRRSFDP